jgi:hypothetical protein
VSGTPGSTEGWDPGVCPQVISFLKEVALAGDSSQPGEGRGSAEASLRRLDQPQDCKSRQEWAGGMSGTWCCVVGSPEMGECLL